MSQIKHQVLWRVSEQFGRLSGFSGKKCEKERPILSPWAGRSALIYTSTVGKPTPPTASLYSPSILFYNVHTVHHCTQGWVVGGGEHNHNNTTGGNTSVSGYRRLTSRSVTVGSRRLGWGGVSLSHVRFFLLLLMAR